MVGRLGGALLSWAILGCLGVWAAAQPTVTFSQSSVALSEAEGIVEVVIERSSSEGDVEIAWEAQSGSASAPATDAAGDPYLL